ncbi:MAG: TPM domain-containing protein [Clostridia bacterium]|nr:TPM domain-containing protein [Clostridia bacterium]
MIKKIISLLFALLLIFAFSLSVAAESGMPRLIDNADLLTDSEHSAITKELDDTSARYKVDIVIVTVDTVGGYSSDYYIEKIYDEYGYGYGSTYDGVMLLVAMEERDYRILSNGLGADAISLDDIDSIGEEVSAFLSDGEYTEAFECFIDECSYEINGEINGFPFDYLKNIAIALVIGFVVAFIVTGVMRSKLRSVKRQLAATQYTKEGSMQVKYANDFYLYSTVTRIRKQNNTHRVSGSSRNVGGGKF